jgi:hypothetical protein
MMLVQIDDVYLNMDTARDIYDHGEFIQVYFGPDESRDSVKIRGAVCKRFRKWLRDHAEVAA